MAQNDKAWARQLINKNSDSGGLNVDALCNELSTIVMMWTYTVFEVFNALTERGANQAAHEQVATNLINRINGANLIQLAQTIHGRILLERIWYIMNCQANGGQQVCRYIAVADARAQEIERSKTPRQLSKEEMDWYSNYNQTNLIFYERDASSKLHSTGGARNNFDANVCWELPKEGVGFKVYNRDDLKSVAALKDRKGLDQIGTKETIDAMMQIAKEWSSLFPNRLLQYGDISRPGGINTSDHKTHNNGKAFDIRPLRNDSQTGDGASLTYKDASYDVNLTKQFVLLVLKLYPGTVFLFNDENLHERDADVSRFIKPSGGHNNHLHVILPGGN